MYQVRLSASPDPLAIFTDPPPDETQAERVTREAREALEKRVSDEIDDGIKKDKARLKKEQEILVRVLLLGQAESGKSTTLKSMLNVSFVSLILR
jgi:guanine nucleotide-binding protein subunit alpha